LHHLDECFARFGEIRGEALHPEEIELALWFHDAIYDVRRRDNEKRSADWARSIAAAARLPGPAAYRVHALVMATRHSAVPADPDQRILVDVDLSILGAGAGRFDEYERQIREEYAHVPDFLFRRGRKAILEDMAARPRIFSTGRFFDRYEAAARENLQRSIGRLAS
jgi:predicted metal-dependent HD superfamily phosphohydrolase